MMVSALTFALCIVGTFATAPPEPWTSGPQVVNDTSNITITNVANASATTPDGGALNASAVATTLIERLSEMVVTKNASLTDNGATGYDVGDQICYTINITNTGVTGLSNLTVTDDQDEFAGSSPADHSTPATFAASCVDVFADPGTYADPPGSSGPDILEPGQTVWCTYCHNVTLADVE
jgi:hypothetical protein